MKALLAVVALTISSLAIAQPDQAALAAFERLVSRAVAATDKTSDVYLVPANKKWARRYVAIADVKFDVRRTDSLVSPIIGQVTFTQITLISPRFDSRAEAEATSAIDKGTPARHDAVTLSYAYRDRVWSFTSGEYEARFGQVNTSPLRGAVRDLGAHEQPRLAAWRP